MQQGQALELYFDHVSEERVTRSIPPALVGESILDIGARPHISLALFVPPVDEEALIDIAKRLAGMVPKFRLYLSAVGVFPGDEGAIYLAPSVVPELTAAHRLGHDLIAQAGLPTDPLYRPGRWVPHCTVVMGVPDHLISSQVDLLRKSDVCGWVGIASVGAITYRPVVEIAQFDLAE